MPLAQPSFRFNANMAHRSTGLQEQIGFGSALERTTYGAHWDDRLSEDLARRPQPTRGGGSEAAFSAKDEAPVATRDTYGLGATRVANPHRYAVSPPQFLAHLLTSGSSSCLAALSGAGRARGDGAGRAAFYPLVVLLHPPERQSAGKSRRRPFRLPCVAASQHPGSHVDCTVTRVGPTGSLRCVNPQRKCVMHLGSARGSKRSVSLGDKGSRSLCSRADPSDAPCQPRIG